MTLPPLPFAEWDLEGPATVTSETPPTEDHGGWGAEEWGAGPWGDGEDATIFADVGVDSVTIIARDTLKVTFSESMKNNDLLSAVSTYSVTPFDTATPVVIKNVYSGTSVGTTYVLLTITEPTPGGIYDIRVTAPIISLNGVIISQPTQRITYRRTKTDSLLSSRPEMYSLISNAHIRSLLTAIGLEDDKIGGSQSDGEQIFRNDD